MRKATQIKELKEHLYWLLEKNAEPDAHTISECPENRRKYKKEKVEAESVPRRDDSLEVIEPAQEERHVKVLREEESEKYLHQINLNRST